MEVKQMKKRKISNKIIELAELEESDYIKYRNDIDFNKTGLAKILNELEKTSKSSSSIQDVELKSNE